MRSPSIDRKLRIESQQSYNRKINIPTSKSRANRMLFLAAITPGEVILTNMPNSSDVEDMIHSLKSIGLKISVENDSLKIENSFPQCESQTNNDPVVVECGYGGTTTRFLAGLLALGSRTYYLEPSGHMRSRPMQEMLKPLLELGVHVEMNTDEAWMKIRGPINNKLKIVDVDTSRSTQFASAIAMSMSQWGGGVRPIEMNASESYFKMTLDCIDKAKKSDWKIPIDFSSLSYPVALATLLGEVEILNYTGRDDLQPDSIVIDIVKQMGAKVVETANCLKVSKAANFDGWSGDCSGFPDLVPTLCFLNSFSSSTSILSNLEVLKHKECDRLLELEKILQLFEREYRISTDSITTLATTRRSISKAYDAPDDHRMIMVVTLFMKVLSGGEISNWHHIKKSYPYFFEDLAQE